MRFALASPGLWGTAAPYQPKQQDMTLPVAAVAPPPASGDSTTRSRDRQATPEATDNGFVTSAAAPLGQGQKGQGVIGQLQRSVQSRSQKRRAVAARSLACELLGLTGVEDLQDFLACMILSECAYKKVELSKEELASTVSSFINMFPPNWVTLEAVQVSRSDLPQHYLLATGRDALYVAFMGTKQPRDLVTDAKFLHEAVWAESVALASDKQSVPAAHSGFLQRARAINVEQLHELAAASGRRLVLCGHSLGGAVAKLSTLRLLREMPQWPAPKLKCMCFATPAVGNAALADLVKNAGWGTHFKTYFLPEDQVMRLMSFSQTKKPKAAAASAATSGERDDGFGREAAPVEAGSSSGPGPVRMGGRRWSWPGTMPGPDDEQKSPEPALSMVASMDAAEAALEEILSPGPVGLAGSAAATGTAEAAGAKEAGRHSCVAAAGSEASPSSCRGGEASPSPAPHAPPFNLGLAFALQQKRLFRAVEKLAGHARIPLPLPQAYFHNFGAQLLLHADRAYSSDQLQSSCPPLPAEAGATSPVDASDAGAVPRGADLSHGVKGPFNYHRMVSHRLRVLSIIAGVLPEEQRAQHQARVAAATAASASRPAAAPAGAGAGSGETSAGPAPASSRPLPRPAASRRAAPVRLMTEGLYPRICAQRAIARLPIQLDQEAEGGGQAAGPSSGGSSAGSRDRPMGDTQPGVGGSKGGLLAGLWGKRNAEEQVSLTMEVEGHNLQYCHHAVARLSLGPGPGPSQGQGPDLSVALPTEVVRVVADPERVVHALSLLQDRLHQVAGSIGRYIGRAKLDKAAAAVAPSSKMLVRITLPRSAARQLASQACAAPAPPAPGSPAAPPPLPQASLTLHIKSHFHEDAVAVSVQPYKAAMLGTSLTATTLLQAALLAPAPKPTLRGVGSGTRGGAEPGAGGAGMRGPGARLGAAAAFAVTMSSTVACWWRPQPLRWAQRFWTPLSAALAPPSPYLSDLPLLPPSLFPDASYPRDPTPPPSVGVEWRTALQPHLTAYDHAGLGEPEQLPFGRGVPDRRGVAEAPQGHSPSVGIDGHDGTAAAAAAAAAGGAQAQPQQQPRALRALQPVAGLLLVMRFIQQATARMVATRVIGAAAAAAAGGAASQQAPMPAGAALLMRRRAASYAASVVLKQLEPSARSSPSASSIAATQSDGHGRVPVVPGGWLPTGVRLLANFGRAPYLQLVGNVLRPRWVGVGSRAAQTASLLARTLPSHGAPGRDASALCGGGGSGGVSRRRQGAWWGSVPWGLRRRAAPQPGPGDGAAEPHALLEHTSPFQIEEEEALLKYSSLLEAHGNELALMGAGTGADGAVQDGAAGGLWLSASQPPLLQPGSCLAAAASWPVDKVGEGAAAAAGPGQPGGHRGDGGDGGRPKRRSSSGLGFVRASSSGGPLQQLALEQASPRMLRSISYNATELCNGKAAAAGRQALRKQPAPAGSPPVTTPTPAAAQQYQAPGAKAPPRPSNPNSTARQAGRDRQKAAALLGVPPETSCLGGSLVLHNVLARAPVASPFVVLRALTASMRRQAARLRRPGGSAPPPPQQQQSARRSVGPLHPAGALLHVYNFIRGIPFWIQQKRSRGSLMLDQDWKVLLVAASALDPIRLLQGRDFARLALRAKAAGVSLLPVLLTSEAVPPQQEERARLALGAACGVAAAAVRTVVVEPALLQLQLQAVAGSDDGCSTAEAAEKARAMAGRASGIAGIQQQLQTLLLEQQQQQHTLSHMHFCHPRAARSRL